MAKDAAYRRSRGEYIGVCAHGAHAIRGLIVHSHKTTRRGLLSNVFLAPGAGQRIPLAPIARPGPSRARAEKRSRATPLNFPHERSLWLAARSVLCARRARFVNPPFPIRKEDRASLRDSFDSFGLMSLLGRKEESHVNGMIM